MKPLNETSEPSETNKKGIVRYAHNTSMNFAMAREIAPANEALAAYFAVLAKEAVLDKIVAEVFDNLSV